MKKWVKIMSMKNKEDGIMTVEASFIFPWLVILIFCFLKLNFNLHDLVLADVVKILGGLRYEQAVDFYYEEDKEEICEEELFQAPVVTSDSDYQSEQLWRIEGRVEDYYEEHCLGNEVTLSATALDEVLSVHKNAEILRMGSRAIQVIGDVIE